MPENLIVYYAPAIEIVPFESLVTKLKVVL